MNSVQLESNNVNQYVAFEGIRCIAEGSLAGVVVKTKKILDLPEHKTVLIFDGETSELVEIDFRGPIEDVLSRLQNRQTKVKAEAIEKRAPGRPKLGVVAREITLLPRHWEWLATQPGGASVTLRRLVEAAKRASFGKDRERQSQEAAYRFMTAMAGNLSNFEEALRAFYAKNTERFQHLTESWPPDIRMHANKLVAASLRASGQESLI